MKRGENLVRLCVVAFVVVSPDETGTKNLSGEMLHPACGGIQHDITGAGCCKL